MSGVNRLILAENHVNGGDVIADFQPDAIREEVMSDMTKESDQVHR